MTWKDDSKANGFWSYVRTQMSYMFSVLHRGCIMLQQRHSFWTSKQRLCQQEHRDPRIVTTLDSMLEVPWSLNFSSLYSANEIPRCSTWTTMIWSFLSAIFAIMTVQYTDLESFELLLPCILAINPDLKLLFSGLQSALNCLGLFLAIFL